MMIETKELEALMKFASKDDARVTIHGLIVYPSPASTLAATDGHCAMVRGSLEDLRLQGRLIPYDTVMEAIRVAKARKVAEVRVDREQGVIFVGDTPHGLGFVRYTDTVEYVNAPPMSAIYAPSVNGPAQRIGISAEILSRLAVVSKALKSKTSAWTFTFAGELEPIHAEYLNWYALVMPCRV